jgi:antigen flippase
VAAASLTVWLLRDFAIWLLFSDRFTAMRDLFAWQLVGDVLKGRGLCLWLSGDRQSVAAFLYSDGNQPVHAVDRILALAYPGARRNWRGAGVYGYLYCLFRPL